MTAPYGTWPSPIDAAEVAAASPRFDGAMFVGGEPWWAESVPEEGGRMTVRRRRAGGTAETVLPAPWNARSAVHEYGGGAWTADEEETVYFVERTDGRVYALPRHGEPTPVTAPDPAVRFGGLRLEGGRLLAVRESFEDSGVRHAIVELDRDGGDVRVLAEGTDFVAQPALSPDGTRLAWIGWDHPAMPWDRTRLFVAPLGRPEAAVALTTGATAALQPLWLDDDTLVYADEPTGRWNLVAVSLQGVQPTGSARPLAPADADTGGALWVLGSRWAVRLDDGRIVAIRTDGSDRLVVIEADGTTDDLRSPVSAGLTLEDADGARILVFGASATAPAGLWLVDVDSGASELVAGGTSPWSAEWLPLPRALTVPGPRGDVHAFDYPPTSPVADAPADERPPYLVLVHGGPTSHVGGAVSGAIAYFTSRGIGVLDVNYGGSTGYGRAYRERLRGEWGVVDVEDVAAAASGLAASGAADPDRLTVRGGSAGGWTVLGTLVATEVFAAGISRYGVGDARALAAETHDFEARYLDGLIGPLPAAEELYIARSPLSRAERFRAPLLLLQGTEDAVVPPSQAEAIRAALAERGVPHALVLYDGEAHGFRRAETVADALEKELAFLGAVFGFTPPGVPPLSLE